MHDFKADFAAAVAVANPQSIFGIAEAIGGQILKSAGKFNTPDNRKLAREAALEVYDEACRVIDIPALPEPFESSVEAAGRRSFDAFLSSILGA